MEEEEYNLSESLKRSMYISEKYMKCSENDEIDNDIEKIIDKLNCTDILSGKNNYEILVYFCREIQEIINDNTKFYKFYRLKNSINKFLINTSNIYLEICSITEREKIRINFIKSNIPVYLNLRESNDIFHLYDILVNIYCHVREYYYLKIMTRSKILIYAEGNDISLDMVLKENIDFDYIL